MDYRNFNPDSSDSDGDNDNTNCEDSSQYCDGFPVLSLQNTCLETIINSLRRFNWVFHTTEDGALRRNLLFLQKMYSAHILREVLEDGLLNETYLDFLVNEHLKEIRVGVLARCGEEAILKRMAEIGYSFEKVHIDVLFYLELDRLVPFINNFISHLSNVQKLLIHCKCDDETLRVISTSCPNLKELYINGICTVSDEGVKHLSSMKGTVGETNCSLKILSLKYTDVEESGVAFLLKTMPSLEVLTYHQLPNVLYRMHKPDLMNGTLSHARKYNLTTLDLCHKLLEAVPNVHDILTICSEVCPRLKKLHTLISNENHLEIVSLFSALESLAITGTRKEPLDLNCFLKSNGRLLKELKLDRFAFSPNILVECCPNLESLSIGKNTFQIEEQVSNFSYLHRMRQLCLEKFIFSNSDSEMCVNLILDSSPNLETFIMRECELQGSDVSTKLLKFCTSSVLQFISFRSTDVDILLLESIVSNCSLLETLIIKYCYNIECNQLARLFKISKSQRKCLDIKHDDDHQLSFLSSGSSDDF